VILNFRRGKLSFFGLYVPEEVRVGENEKFIANYRKYEIK
jgi:hypothetical protein